MEGEQRREEEKGKKKGREGRVKEKRNRKSTNNAFVNKERKKS